MFVSSMVGEFKNCNKYFISIKEVIDFITNMKVYRIYERVNKWIDGLSEITDNAIQNEILEYVKRFSNLRFNSYNKLIKYLQAKKNVINRKLNSIIPKIAYEYLDSGGLMMAHNDTIEDLNELEVVKQYDFNLDFIFIICTI